jgi:ribosome-associated protein
MMYEKNPQLKKLLKELEEIQAIDVTVIDVSEHTTVTDFMVVCGGRSSRHVKAVAEHIMEQMKTAGFPAIGISGLTAGDWALVDFGDIVVHVMQAETRAFYNLEGLWQNQPQ